MRTPPPGEILAVRVESLDAKDALLEIAPPGFFTIPHFQGYAALLDRAAESARPRRARCNRRRPHGNVGAGAAPEARNAKEGTERHRQGDLRGGLPPS